VVAGSPIPTMGATHTAPAAHPGDRRVTGAGEQVAGVHWVTLQRDDIVKLASEGRRAVLAMGMRAETLTMTAEADS